MPKTLETSTSTEKSSEILFESVFLTAEELEEKSMNNSLLLGME